MKIKFLDRTNSEKEILQAYGDSLQGFLFMTGKNGTGKSEAAKSIYEMVSRCTLPAYDHDLAIFVTQADMNTQYISSIQKATTDYILEQYKETKLLVIDDLGTRNPTEAFMDFVYAIMDYRWNQKQHKATIITTNLSPKDIQSRFGDAFYSRATSGICMAMMGADRRAKGWKAAIMPTVSPLTGLETPRERCLRILELYPGSFDLFEDMLFLKQCKNGVMYYDPVQIPSDRLMELLDACEEQLGIGLHSDKPKEKEFIAKEKYEQLPLKIRNPSDKRGKKNE